MANPSLVTSAEDKIEQALSFREKDLISRPEWGSITFESVEPDLKRIFTILSQLKILPLENLPDQTLNGINSKIDEIISTLDSIDSFSIEQSNPAQARDSLGTQVSSKADQFYTTATPWIPYLAYLRGDVEQNIQALTHSVQEASELVDSTRGEIKKKSNEINSIITKAREASAAAGAAVFTQDFDTEADSIRNRADKWLYAASALAATTIGLAVFIFFTAEAGLDTGQLIQKSAARLVVLAVLFTGALWCGRVYKALLHQATVNRHRALSLQTFQAFSSAAADDTTKDAVLMEATKAVFGNVSTGLVDREPSERSGVQVVELAKRLSGESGET